MRKIGTTKEGLTMWTTAPRVRLEIPPWIERLTKLKEKYDMKECNKCGQSKPYSAFNKRATTIDGLQYICRECSKAAYKRYAAENPEKRAAQRRQWVVNNPEKKRALNKGWADRNPEKVAASDRLWAQKNREKKNAINRRSYWRVKNRP